MKVKYDTTVTLRTVNDVMTTRGYDASNFKGGGREQGNHSSQNDGNDGGR